MRCAITCTHLNIRDMQKSTSYLIQKVSRRAADCMSKTMFFCVSLSYYVLTIMFEIMKKENAAV